MSGSISHATFVWMAGLQPVVWTLLLAVPVLLLVRILMKTVYNALFHPLSNVPGPFWAKIADYYLAVAQLRGERAHALLELHKQYGPVVRVGTNEVSISDWRVYRDVYSHRFARKHEDFYKAVSMVGHRSVFTMSDPVMHSARRKMQSQPYSQQAVLENETMIVSKATVMVDRMISEARASTSNKTVDVFTICARFSLEVIMQCGFNYDVITRTEVDSHEYLKVMDLSAKLVPINTLMPFLSTSKWAKYIPGVIGTTFQAVERWIAMTNTLLDIFEQDEKAFDKTFRLMATPLLTNTDENLGRKLHRSEVMEEALAIAFAGSGTTSTTLTYLLYRLSQPEMARYQHRLRIEILKAREANGRHLDLKELQNLPFLNAVVKETMRLHPSLISTLPRTLDTELAIPSDTKDRTIVLPKGVVVGMQNYVHHRDAAVFPEPDSFLPERWLEPDASRLRDMNGALTPFSHGPSNCIGQNLAKAELLLATAEMFARLQVELNSQMLDSDMDMEDRFSMAPRSRKLILDIEWA